MTQRVASRFGEEERLSYDERKAMALQQKFDKEIMDVSPIVIDGD